jgi:hypothetical protein
MKLSDLVNNTSFICAIGVGNLPTLMVLSGYPVKLSAPFGGFGKTFGFCQISEVLAASFLLYAGGIHACQGQFCHFAPGLKVSLCKGKYWWWRMIPINWK